MEIPIDLIEQLQISLRKNASLSSYNPDDRLLPNLPSVEEAITSLDPLPPYLRCKHCNGRLLRDVQSLICVFCGKEACKDALPEPINFQNTLGCRWLLESLDLDGTETVGPPIESNNSNRSRTASKKEFPLSDLLHLEIKWICKSEKLGNSLSNETLVQGTSSLNLAGLNFENFVAEKEINSTSSRSKELSLRLEQTESKQSTKSPVNLNLFEDIQPLENALVSNAGDSNYSDSDGETNFQPATSTSLKNESASHDPVVGSIVDLSAHMDEVFGPVNDSNEKKDRELTGSASMAYDWSQNVNSSSSTELALFHDNNMTRQ